ncbi:MAG: hypothetical protein WBD00_03910 [Candidatus Omnitrophota bacterium]|jgi:hypothetical protein
MKIFKITLILVLVMCLQANLIMAEEYKMSSDPRLLEPKASFEKGLEYIEKGDKAFRGRPGLAQKMYEHAEDYILKAEFLYKELGQRHGIDVSHEVAACQRVYRQTHVKVNKSRKEARNR